MIKSITLAWNQFIDSFNFFLSYTYMYSITIGIGYAPSLGGSSTTDYSTAPDYYSSDVGKIVSYIIL